MIGITARVLVFVNAYLHGTSELLVTSLKISHSAKLFADQHGADAPIKAVRRADELLEAGDMIGSAVWLGILTAVEELIRREPKEGERVN